MSQAPLRVVHVSEADELSGGAMQLISLADGLKDKGFRSWIACRAASALAKAAREAGVPVFELPIRQDYDVLSAYQLARFIAAEKIDVVHAHHSRSHGVSLMAKLLGPRPGPILVVSRRVSFKVGGNPFSLLKYRSTLIDSYAAVAEAVKDVLVSSGVDPERVAVVRSGVDVRRFSPRSPDPAFMKSLRLPEGVPIVGKIANASPWKGQTTFLEAASILARGGKAVHFLLAGRDTDGPWAKGEISRLGLEGRVTMAGFRTDIPDLLACLAVSVNAAVQGEGLSGALRESLCMGIPVVASNIAGNRELLGSLADQFLFAPGDAGALAGRIGWALDHPKETASAVRTWRETVLPEFSLEQTIEKTAALYRRLASERR